MILAPLLVTLALAAPDRSGPPPVRPSPPLDLPEPVSSELGAAARLHHVAVAGVRRAQIDVVVRRGTLHLDGGPSHAADLTGAMVATAGRGLAPRALVERLDALDASLTGWVGARSAGLSVDVPAEQLGEALDVLEAVLRAPRFPARDLARARAERERWLLGDARHSASLLAGSLADAAFYAGDDPRAQRVDLQALRRVRRADLVRRWRRLLAEGPVEVRTAGDLDLSALRPRLAALVAGLGTPGEAPPPLPARPAGAPLVLGVDLPEADQASLLLRVAAPARVHEDRVPFAVVAHALGGHFLSRLNRNLREDKGWTYGGHGSYGAGALDGAWTYSVDVAEGNVGAALGEIAAELERMAREGVSVEERDAAASASTASWNGARATAATAAAFYAAVLDGDEDLSEVRTRLSLVAALPVDGTADVARRWLLGDDRVWVVVGDRAAIEAQVTEALGPVRWVPARDAVLGTLGP